MGERSRPIGVVALACLNMFLAGLDLNIVRLVIPIAAKEFHVEVGVASWLQLAPLLTLTCGLLFSGRLGKCYGYRPVLCAGTLIFTLSSLGSTLAHNLPLILVFRAIQGLGASLMTALTTPMLATYVSPKNTAKFIGLAAAFESFGISMGRVLSGLIIDYGPWQAIFAVNVLLGAGAVLLAFFAIPKSSSDGNASELDFVGALLYGLAACLLLGGINRGAATAWPTFLVLGVLLGVGTSSALFILWERRVAQPLLNLRVLLAPHIYPVLAVTFGKFVVEAGVYFIVPLYLLNILKVSGTTAGLILLVPSVFQTFVGLCMGKLNAWWGDRALGIGGLATAIIMCLLLMLISRITEGSVTLVVGAISLMGLSKGLFIPSNRHWMMKAVADSERPSINALLETSSRSGVMIGIAVFEAIAATVSAGSEQDRALLLGYHATFVFATILALGTLGLFLWPRKATH